MENTSLFELSDIKKELVSTTLDEVCDALEERGYDPVNQIVGYLISGDPGYISSHKDARTKILKLERTEILEILLRSYIEK